MEPGHWHFKTCDWQNHSFGSHILSPKHQTNIKPGYKQQMNFEKLLGS